MTYKMFIDDERFPKTDDWTIVRSSQEAIDCVLKKGIPSHIAFDHDLGGTAAREGQQRPIVYGLVVYEVNDDGPHMRCSV